MRAQYPKKKPGFRGRAPARENRINEEITEPEVRLVTDDGAELIKTSVALARAKEGNVDLVEIAKAGDVPIVKIIDYGKFKFEKTKKDKENKKKQKVIHIKEVKIGPKIDTGDFERKTQLAREFLEEGDQVKVSMRFRGREMAHTEIGKEKLMELVGLLEDVGTLDKKPVLEGRQIILVIRPKGKKTGGSSKSADEEEVSAPDQSEEE